MHYKIYPDVIFLANLLMNYTVLSVSCRLCKTTTTYARLALASMAGAVWSVIVAVTGSMLSVPVAFCTYLCMPFAMLYIAGSRGKAGEWLYRYAVFMGIAMLTGGMMGMLREWSSGVCAAIAAAVLFAQAAVPLIRYMTGYVKRRSLLYSVRLELDGRSVDIMGLFDTGNSLTDPYNGEPVCIAEKEAVEMLVHDGEWGDGIRLIPYRSLGREHGLMRLFTIDSMTIEYEGKSVRYEHPELALYEGSLSSSGEYSMILNTASLDRK